MGLYTLFYYYTFTVVGTNNIILHNLAWKSKVYV